MHAEQNAIATAARFGVGLDGATLYSTLQPCFGCLKELRQAGIRDVIFRRRWQARHPDYEWVADEYERLLEHYRATGILIAELAGEAPSRPVEVELGQPD